MKRLAVKKSLCVGCRVCEIVCSAYHSGEFNPKRALMRVPTAHPTPSAPVFCRQCNNPPCIESCGTGAIFIDEKNNFVMLDQSKCNGCGECLPACPFNAIFLDPVTGLALKCDLCIELDERKCVEYCPTRALGVKENKKAAGADI